LQANHNNHNNVNNDMAVPCIFIVWGTKIRVRQLGVRADFCDGCLLVTPQQVSAIEQSGHIYYVTLGYSEQIRVGECLVCGEQSEVNKNCELVSGDIVSSPTIETLVDQTNPGLLKVLPEIAREIDYTIPSSQRNDHLAEQFCARYELKIKEAARSLGGWLGLIMLAFAAPVVFAFLNFSIVVGVITLMGWLVTLFVVRHWMIQRHVANRLCPKLESFLQATGLDMDTIDAVVASDKADCPKLRKHLLNSCYEYLRLGHFDTVNGVETRFLLPVSGQAPQQGPQSHDSASRHSRSITQ
jgi:hypothetical protein